MMIVAWWWRPRRAKSSTPITRGTDDFGTGRRYRWRRAVLRESGTVSRPTGRAAA
ncbi:hypothetical protein STRTUCAR8_00920 [Streptomyces turgidiscabies Car8]|uniref:Uncharacterized protein n=1 Tax=Streptomyces turgidiscabies (strain Car8) TaxID=698760 RepID=L7EWP7_STRT8|nr:hypothetical protein STRTUCAR8_00920 [Streptomyces turgidiscabies Car8]